MIAEIETDKATMEVEAVDEGTLGKILVPEGTADVAVNTPIAVILGDGESSDGTLERHAERQRQKADDAAAPQPQSDGAKPRRRPSATKRQRPQPLPPQPRGRSPIPTCRKAPRWSP